MAQKKGLPLLKRPLDLVLVVFLFFNIPMIMLLEAQVVCPASIFPKFLQAFIKWHIRANGDFFMKDMPAYFKGIVALDILFRLPMIILNCRAFTQGRDWGRLTGIFYGVHSATSTVPLLSEIFFSSSTKKLRLLMVYSPHLVVAIYILVRVLPVQSPFITPYPWPTQKPTTSAKPRRA